MDALSSHPINTDQSHYNTFPIPSVLDEEQQELIQPSPPLLGRIRAHFEAHPIAWKVTAAVMLILLFLGTFGAVGYVVASRPHNQSQPSICKSLTQSTLLPVPLTGNCTVQQRRELMKNIAQRESDTPSPIIQELLTDFFAQIEVPSCSTCNVSDIYSTAFKLITSNEQGQMEDEMTVEAFNTFETLCCSKFNQPTFVLQDGQCTQAKVNVIPWLNFIDERKEPYVTPYNNTAIPAFAERAEQLGIAPAHFSDLANATITAQVKGFEQLRINVQEFMIQNPANATAIQLNFDVANQLVGLRVGQVVGQPYFQDQNNSGQYPQNALSDLFHILYWWTNSASDRMQFDDTYSEIVPYWDPNLFYSSSCYMLLVAENLSGNGTSFHEAISTLKTSLDSYNALKG